MHKLFVIALVSLLLSPVLSQQNLEEKLERAFKTGSFDLMDTDFSPTLLSAIPLQQLNEIAEEYGQGLSDVTKKRAEGNALVFEMLYEEYTRDLTIALDSDQRIAGLWFGPLKIPVEKMRAEIESLEGSVSVLLRSSSRDEVLFSFNKEKPLALASTFKLYVLAELFRQIEAGEIDPDAIYELREEDKSLPSGILQSWPAGTPITIATLANLMISISDNTAADILIDIVGRENIERDLELFGMKNDLNHPFLKTKELFKLWGLKEEEIERYLRLSSAEKRGFLNALAQRPLPDPRAIAQSTLEIEWFASAQEITDLFQRIVYGRVINDKALIDELLSTLAIEKLIPEAEMFEYAGYKGGNLPGVISLNWMLYSEGEWYFLSFIWNSETGVNETKAIDLCRSLMLLI